MLTSTVTDAELSVLENFDDDELLRFLRIPPENRRWLERNRKRIPGAFQVGRKWRYERAAIEKQRLTTGQVLLPAPQKRDVT